MSGSDKPYLLVIEDDPGLQSQLRWSLEDYETVFAEDRDSAIAALRRFEPPVVTLDLGLPPDPTNASAGLALLEEILSLAPDTKVVVVTGNDDRENALRAVALGACDFYQKPVDPDLLGVILARAFRLAELERENRRLQAAQMMTPLDGIIASSPEMLKVCRTVEKVAPTNVTTLILGESGTGKELVARALHNLSGQGGGPFVAINCAAIPENLLESELFGYEKGAFTGASRTTRGKIEYASGGTLFLDEVGDLPLALQAKLLRFLQERVIERVGGRSPIGVDVRVVCATHRDLKALIAEGGFREDLYYRISEITITIPPLRERPGDAVVIARTMLRKYARELGGSAREFSAEAVRAIENYAWPGNVRELENRVKRAAIMAEGSRVEPEDLELCETGELHLPLNLREVRESAEREALTRALGLSEGNLSRASKLLGITRPTLYALLDKYDMRP